MTHLVFYCLLHVAWDSSGSPSNHPHLSKRQSALPFGSRQNSPNHHQCLFLPQHTLNPAAYSVASVFKTHLPSNPFFSPPPWLLYSKLHPLAPGLLLQPPVSASTVAPCTLLLTALPEFPVEDMSGCILPLLKTFSASHFNLSQSPCKGL